MLLRERIPAELHTLPPQGRERDRGMKYVINIGAVKCKEGSGGIGKEENKGKWGEVRESQIKRDKMDALQGHGFTEVLVFA